MTIKQLLKTPGRTIAKLGEKRVVTFYEPTIASDHRQSLRVLDGAILSDDEQDSTDWTIVEG